MVSRILPPVVLLLSHLHAVVAQDANPGGPTNEGIAQNCNAYHTVVDGDTCQSVPALFGITFDQFLEWNPAVSDDCLTNFWLGNAYCVGVANVPDDAPGGPTNEGIAENCTGWHTIVDGDTCQTVPADFGITFDQFLDWNRAVSEDCLTNFWLGNAYCVRVGDSATPSSSSPVSSTITSTRITSSLSSTTTVTSAFNTTYSTRVPVTSWNLTTTTAETTWPPRATQTGQPSDCVRWHLVAAGETCETVLNRYRSITSGQLFEWNPELHVDCSGLYADYWICVGTQSMRTTAELVWYSTTANFTTPSPTAYSPTTMTLVDSIFTPTPTHGPMPDNCHVFYLASSGDTCDTVLATYTYITREQFFEWNPVLGGVCNALWSDTYYCAGAFDDGSKPQPAVVTKTPASIPSGSPTDCVSWYQTTVDDTCDDIVRMFGTFNLDAFISWNPAVNNDCSRITQGTYYCVAKDDTPATRTDSSTTSTATSMPTQTGISTSCADYWLVSESDTCDSIATRKGTTKDILIELNPALGSTCSGLTANFYICVAADSGTISSTITSIASTSRSSSTTTATTSVAETLTTPTPSREGMTSGCRRFYLAQTGDLCWSIASAAGITTDQFIEWNPVVGDGCSNLWPNYYYCIGVAGTATTITSGSAVPTV